MLESQEDGEGGVDIFGVKLGGPSWESLDPSLYLPPKKDGKQNWPWTAHQVS